MNDQDFLKKLGKRISSIRKAKGYSQLDLGSIIDMEKSNLSAIENGRQNPSSLTLKKIADALQVQVLNFFEF
jgi:transcriptional regulator with XRE-family HTH domain